MKKKALETQGDCFDDLDSEVLIDGELVKIEEEGDDDAENDTDE